MYNIIKKITYITLALVIVLTSSSYNVVVQAAAPKKIISVEETGENVVWLVMTRKDSYAHIFYIRGKGQIDRRKYIDALKGMTGYFREYNDGSFGFVGSSTLRIIHIDTSGGDICAPEDCTDLFRGLSGFAIEGTGKFDTSQVTNMERMFMGMYRRWDAPANNFLSDSFDTRNVVNFKSMFEGCSQFNQELPKNFITSSGKYFDGMFKGCTVFNKSLQDHFDTKNAVSMNEMFRGSGFNNDLGDKFNTSNVTSMEYMFAASAFNNSLGDKFDTSKVESMKGMFASNGAYGKNLFNKEDIAKFDTSSCKNMNSMFAHTKGLKNLDLSSWDTSKVEDMDNFLYAVNSHNDISKGLIDLGKWELDALTKNAPANFIGDFPISKFRGEVTDSNTNSTKQIFLLRPRTSVFIYHDDNGDIKRIRNSGNNYIKANNGVFRVYIDETRRKEPALCKYNIRLKPHKNLDKNLAKIKLDENLAKIKLENVDYGTKLGDLTDKLNDGIKNNLPNGDKYRAKFINPNKILTTAGAVKEEMEIFLKTPDPNNFHPDIAKVGMTVLNKKSKLEDNAFTGVYLTVEKGANLSEALISKSDDNYDFSWENGDTTFDTIGEKDAVIVCTSKNDDWEDTKINVKVAVKDSMKATEIGSITTDDILSVKNTDIVAKVTLGDNEVDGTFAFDPALNTLNLKNGDNEVNVKFTPTEQQKFALKQEINFTLTLKYNKKDNNSNSSITGNDNENTGSGNDNGNTNGGNNGNGNNGNVSSNANGNNHSSSNVNSNSGSDIVIVTSKKDRKLKTDTDENKEKDKDDKIDVEKTDKKDKLTEEEFRERLSNIVDEHFNVKVKSATKNLVDKYLKHKKEEINIQNKEQNNNKGIEEEKSNDKKDKKDKPNKEENKSSKVDGVDNKDDNEDNALGDDNDTENHLVTNTGREIVDVSRNEYYSEAVKFGIESGILKGTEKNKFSPNKTATNAAGDTIICRIAGAEEVIKDELVAKGKVAKWYTPAVEWAKASNIIYDDDIYMPESDMRRDSFILHLYRYSDKLGFMKEKKDEVKDSVLDKFTDREKLTDIKRVSMKWAVNNGIIIGTDESKIEPDMTITRGQLALVIERFIEYLSIYMK